MKSKLEIIKAIDEEYWKRKREDCTTQAGFANIVGISQTQMTDILNHGIVRTDETWAKLEKYLNG